MFNLSKVVWSETQTNLTGSTGSKLHLLRRFEWMEITFFPFDPVMCVLHMCEPNLNAWQPDRCPGPANICGVWLAEVLQLCTSTTVAGMETDVEIVLQQNISKQHDWQKPKRLQTNKSTNRFTSNYCEHFYMWYKWLFPWTHMSWRKEWISWRLCSATTLSSRGWEPPSLRKWFNPFMMLS